MSQSDKGVVFVCCSLSNLAIHCLTQAHLPEGSNLRYHIPESFMEISVQVEESQPGGKCHQVAPNNMEKYLIHTASTEKKHYFS